MIKMTAISGQKYPSPKLLSVPNIQETGIEMVYKGVINTTNDWNDWKFIERYNAFGAKIFCEVVFDYLLIF